MPAQHKAALLILDGWGIGNGASGDAISHAKTPYFDQLKKNNPHSTLLTFGQHVGLPEGQMGNSEVGHLNIGAGRVVYQDLMRINNAVADGDLRQNPVLQQAFETAKAAGKQLHFMGLVSNGGVHSSQEHLHHLCDLAGEAGLKDVFVHAFLDGRDTDPQSGKGFVQRLQDHLQPGPATLASLIGRYYAMDRDNRWERVKMAYDLLVDGKGEPATDPVSAIAASYDSGVTDEFVKPIIMVDDQGDPKGTIQPGDVVVCFNFRTDRCREITIALTQQDLTEHGMHTLPLHYVTMTRYDKNFSNIPVLFQKDNLTLTLGETLYQQGCTQVRAAETEKYPHVTFFFSGMREEPFEGEDRILVNSPKVATYDLQPEMSAPELTQAVVNKLQQDTPDFLCLNFANPDMVGHTGDINAVVKAVETVDGCVKQVVEAGRKLGYQFIVIADHGNADYMLNPDGSPNTAHSTNLVPCVLVSDRAVQLKEGKLADVAPTLIDLMGLEQPAEMTGQSLISE